MTMLAKNAEIILLAIWKLKDNAYGMSIIEQVEKDTGFKWLPGTIYGTLARLKKKGYVKTINSKKGPHLVGRPRVYYRLTKLGVEKLICAQEAVKGIWSCIPDLGKNS